MVFPRDKVNMIINKVQFFLHLKKYFFNISFRNVNDNHRNIKIMFPINLC